MAACPQLPYLISTHQRGTLCFWQSGSSSSSSAGAGAAGGSSSSKARSSSGGGGGGGGSGGVGRPLKVLTLGASCTPMGATFLPHSSTLAIGDSLGFVSLYYVSHRLALTGSLPEPSRVKLTDSAQIYMLVCLPLF